MFKKHLWTAIITPMKEDGSIDYQSFSKVLLRQEEASNGIVLLGSTGEALALSVEDREKIVEFASQQNLTSPLMVGVGGANLKEQKSWISYCENFEQVKSFLMPCPLYSKPGVEGQTLWFKELLDHTNRPTMLYNVPSRTGVKLHQEVVRRLNDHKNFWALKEASGSLEELKLYQSVCGNVKIFSGEDGLIVDQAKIGISGLVSVAGNIWPKETSHYVKLALDKEDTGLQSVWAPAIDALFMQSNPIPTKVLLHLKGIISHPTLRLPLTSLETKDTDPLKTADTNILNWYKKEIL